MSNTLDNQVAFITGGAQRLGAAIARTLHAAGMRVVVHYHASAAAAQALKAELEAARPQSVALVSGDLTASPKALHGLMDQARGSFGRLDVLINNASRFYPTPFAEASEAQWQELFSTNLKAPFFLAQAAAPALRATQGCIVNLADIYGERPLPAHPLYSLTKAGVIMLTRTLAVELAPAVRVNAVAPGAILWPEQGIDEARKQRILARTLLQREGDPGDIARAVLFLIRDAAYTTGQILAVDGGRMVSV
jgi:pteridine reductase